MSDECKTKDVYVVIQENGLIRNSNGRLIGKLLSDIDFDSEHVFECSDKAIEAIGWAHTDCCVTLDSGEDPREDEIPEVLARAVKDLGIRT